MSARHEHIGGNNSQKLVNSYIIKYFINLYQLIFVSYF